MDIVLMILLAISILFIFQQWRYRQRLMKLAVEAQKSLIKTNNKTLEAYKNLYKDYKALEQGMEEQADNYEQQFFSFREQIETSDNYARYERSKREEMEHLVAVKEFVIMRHAQQCDHILTDAVEAMIEFLRPSNLVHNHRSDERCDDNGCETERYGDGTHVFTDKTIVTVPSDG